MKVHERHAGTGRYEFFKSIIRERISSILAEVKPRTLQRAMEESVYGGKMIRPILVMLSCSAVGGSEHEAVDAATAIELLHTSSLIHDDIMDDSPLRRGVPTIHTTHGVPMAILAGDAYIALAFQLMQMHNGVNRERILNVFADSFRHVCEGQGYDLCLSLVNCAEDDAHSLMVEKKTAKLMQSATEIGAMIGTSDQEHIQALSYYGYNLGVAFQAQDDLLDATGDEERMGKPVLIDVKNGRSTYVTSDAFTIAVSDNRADAIHATKYLVQKYTHEACSSLDRLPPCEANEMLRTLARSLMSREA
ncbi:MAG: polyprenyl synthetase family protein [Bacteroidetes bacterium]|nr:polyprenyl synthetase family protein [Bacteroidota bacterium]MCW5894440.1 polyprenyl synthetase family protein [Bacteroidota bacterium]